MSSSQHGDVPTKKRHWVNSWINIRSLRVQLLTIFVGLFTVMSVLVGTVTTVMLHSFQVDQLDHQLAAASTRYARHPPSDAPPDRRWRDPINAEMTDLDRLFYAFQPVDTISARIINGEITAAILSSDGTTAAPQRIINNHPLSVLQALPVDNQPRTRDLDLFGTYRLVATTHQIPFLDTTEILIIGLPMETVQRARYNMIGVEITVGLAALLLATLLAAAVIRLALLPLTRVASAARRVSDLPLHEGEVAPLERVPPSDTDPRSEVGQVGAALNRMLEHVGSALTARQSSQTQLRQFIADASHELRTPLAAIRGYTELTRRYRKTTPTLVCEALDRVEAAAQRMTALVEDLLLLARLDAKRPLAQEPVDLSAMVIEAVTDAHVAGTEHRWLLELPEDVIDIVGDGHRLHQVIANLLANARTHTPKGTTVTVAVTQAQGGVILRVMDNGPGIPPDFQPHLFDRFARRDLSRSRSTGNTGLGLSIVHAVVTAHGGTIDVTSAPGKTSFTVWLPSAKNSQPALS